MTEETTKEITAEDLEKLLKEEQQFLDDAISPGSLGGIKQGGEFLEPEAAGTMYNDEEASKKIVEESQEYYNECAAIAALEHSPGLNLILKRIETLCEKFHSDNENMMRNNEVSPEMIQCNIFAATHFKDLKAWIEGQMDQYQAKVKEAQDAPIEKTL